MSQGVRDSHTGELWVLLRVLFFIPRTAEVTELSEQGGNRLSLISKELKYVENGLQGGQNQNQVAVSR